MKYILRIVMKVMKIYGWMNKDHKNHKRKNYGDILDNIEVNNKYKEYIDK